MGANCCKSPREDPCDAYDVAKEDPWVERTRTIEDTAVLEVDPSFPQDTIDARREQILRNIGSFDLQNDYSQKRI